MKVLVACEFSGVVRKAFRNKGHDAWSCDLIPSEDNSEFHYLGPVQDILNDKWDLMITHPPCDYLSVSGLHWNNRGRGWERTEEALEFVKLLLDAPIEKICLENPVGIISTRIRKPDQIIQPYEFGEDASKRTCLWLKNLPKLPIDPAKRVPGRIVNGKERWSNQTDSGQNRLGPSETRAADRAKTYEGIAQAMADTWG